ncbi:iron complex outermembrane recepter protein [Kushneria avicenniae]|uniref:Iron complex outermembrane recepter protein n=1 Tax=Kushneria avicenniae TaxID=402385 RepID=A0A1I1LLV8_9GAMM|nr:TonB-dependent receptor plug domain-containing protein [Kushneria avicenniae]SFC74031.1 iron complex outermembrane recepter protein [Kushneria avicenniae]
MFTTTHARRLSERGHPTHVRCNPVRKTRLTACIALATTGTWMTGPVGAQSMMPDTPVEPDQQPMVITAVALSSPITVETDPGKPRQPAPASDGADYLKTIPGFSSIRNGGTNGDPVFRGMFGSRLKILTNGSEMLGACPVRMDAPTSYISPENYDRLTVTKGPQSVLWGPGASAATIRFERGPEKFDEPGMRVDGSVMLGTYGRFDRRIDAAAGNGDGYFRVTGNKSEANDYKDGDGNAVPSQWNKWNGDFALGLTPDDDTWLELNAGRGNGEARYAGRGMDGSQFLR